MRVDFAGSCPKDPGEPGFNEDAWAQSDDGSLVALCDGASESYDSRAWAAILARRWVADPEFCPEWLSASLAAYMDGIDVEAMSWSQQAGFERGSFSTLLGLEYIPERRSVEALAVGDTVPVEGLARWLVDKGMERVEVVEVAGEFSPAGRASSTCSRRARPSRCGSNSSATTLESIRPFDPETQRSHGREEVDAYHDRPPCRRSTLDRIDDLGQPVADCPPVRRDVGRPGRAGRPEGRGAAITSRGCDDPTRVCISVEVDVGEAA